jgi:hypothetical protein
MASDVGLRRLFPQELSDKHLTMLNHAVSLTPDATMDKWLRWLVDDKLRLYAVGEGLVGLMRMPEAVWVELAVGPGLAKRSKSMVETLRQLPEVGDLPLMMLVSDPRLERLYAKRGAIRLGVLMRYEGG